MKRPEEITDLTVCRAFLAAWVFLYHVDLYLNFSAPLGPLAGLIRRGYLGVDGFFILSGLILARVHPEFRRGPSGALKFWGRRLARIYPVHLATLLLLALLLLAGRAHHLPPRDPARFALAAFVQNLLLVHGWGFAGPNAWNYPSWSISTEWAGYLLFPALWFAASYFDGWVAIQTVIIGFTLIGLLITRHHGTLNLAFAAGLLRFFPEFIMGLSMARLVPIYADIAPIRRFALIAGAILTPLSAILGADLFAVAGLWFGFFAFILRADAERPALFQAPWLRRLGRLSYCFYMSFAVAELLLTQTFRRQGWSPPSHAFLFATGMTLTTLALALLLHLTVERPCRRTADRWLARPASH